MILVVWRFRGPVYCTIQTKEANVNLGDLYTRNLQQPGSASGWHNITLSLTDCPVETSVVTAIVTGSTDNTGYYKNEGTAENIQIELRDDQDATLKMAIAKRLLLMRSLVMHSFHLRQELSR